MSESGNKIFFKMQDEKLDMIISHLKQQDIKISSVCKKTTSIDKKVAVLDTKMNVNGQQHIDIKETFTNNEKRITILEAFKNKASGIVWAASAGGTAIGIIVGVIIQFIKK